MLILLALLDLYISGVLCTQSSDMVSHDFPVFNKEQSSIDEYFEELEMFMMANFGECSSNRKLAALRTAIGVEGRAVIATFSQQQKETYESLCQALQNHFDSHRHTFVLHIQ